MPRVGLILLAAGESRRMGSPKQLLAVGGVPMLRRAALSALAASMDPLIVVCGAASDAVRGTLAGLPLHIVDNPAWKNGMGSSIHVGLAAACEYDVDAVILSLGDQPLLEAQTFGALVTAWQREGKGVVTSEYSGTVGAPALFARSMFDNLKALPADRGCKKAILELPASMVTRCACPQAAVDIDTPDEYGRLLSASAWPEQTR